MILDLAIISLGFALVRLAVVAFEIAIRPARGWKNWPTVARRSPPRDEIDINREGDSEGRRGALSCAMQRNTRREIARRRVVQFCAIVSARARRFRSTCRRRIDGESADNDFLLRHGTAEIVDFYERM